MKRKEYSGGKKKEERRRKKIAEKTEGMIKRQMKGRRGWKQGEVVIG